MPKLSYSTKWLFSEGFPAAVIGLFVVIHVVQVLRKKYILGRKRKLMTHLPALVGSALTLMYYLYLNLTRGILDVFNCQPIVRDDGTDDGQTYLRTLMMSYLSPWRRVLQRITAYRCCFVCGESVVWMVLVLLLICC